VCQVLAANATLHTTWSRLAGELITWSSYEYRTVTLDDGFAMGSSMMPQKKNPGPCELLRGRQAPPTNAACSRRRRSTRAAPVNSARTPRARFCALACRAS